MSEKAVTLSGLSPFKGSKHRRKRLGKGEGSGLGKTCGKGMKGQKARSGGGVPAGFEGGQMPLHRRLPKIGFTSRNKVLGKNRYIPVSLAKAAPLAADGVVTIEALRVAGLINSKEKVKIVAGGDLSGKISFEAHAFTASAKAAIEAAGGEARVA